MTGWIMFAVCYIAAAVTVGRVLWELDAYADLDVRSERIICMFTGAVWPWLLVRAAWSVIRRERQ